MLSVLRLLSSHTKKMHKRGEWGEKRTYVPRWWNGVESGRGKNTTKPKRQGKGHTLNAPNENNERTKKEKGERDKIKKKKERMGKWGKTPSCRLSSNLNCFSRSLQIWLRICSNSCGVCGVRGGPFRTQLYELQNDGENKFKAANDA